MITKTARRPAPRTPGRVSGARRAARSAAPTIGFVSLGCPKALVDSERVLTQLRAEGYATSSTYDGADLVIVNTCGFIDAAKAESLSAIGEALERNGKVIVTGCLGAQAGTVQAAHPKVLAVTGPHDTAAVMRAVHAQLEKPHDPFSDLVPPQGVKLTPRHSAYLKISEGCNHRCTFCIIPSMRGDLVSRPIGEVLTEAETLIGAGARELLVIAQDTSAYGVDVKYRTGFWRGRPVKTRMLELCRALGALAQASNAWIRLHYVYPYPHVDEVIALMADGLILPYLDVPFQHASPRILKQMKRPANAENVLVRIRAWRARCPEITLRSTFIVGFPGETEREFDALLEFLEAGSARSGRLLRLLAGRGRGGKRLSGQDSGYGKRGASGTVDADAGAHQRGAPRAQGRSGRARARRCTGYGTLDGGCAGDRRRGSLRRRRR